MQTEQEKKQSKKQVELIVLTLFKEGLRYSQQLSFVTVYQPN